MGDRAAAAPVSDAPTQQQVSTRERTGSTGRTASTARGAKVLHSSPALGSARNPQAQCPDHHDITVRMQM